jgi:putative Mg2+ transporter-C (MgtC) family protein
LAFATSHRFKGRDVAIIRNFDADRFLGLWIAFVLATLIGAERQWRQRKAGLRTNVLVAVGSRLR